MGGVKVPCLVDTGSMVSTVTKSFFHQHFEPWGQEELRSCHWLQLRAANGLAIPYLGYLELEVKLCGRVMTSCGVLVVKDRPDGVPPPGILEMNLIRRCDRELFGQHGLALFHSLAVSEAPESVVDALQQCHQASLLTSPGTPGNVRVRGGRALRIPGGVMRIIASTCSEQSAGTTVLFEPLESGLPAGLLASPALLRVERAQPTFP